MFWNEKWAKKMTSGEKHEKIENLAKKTWRVRIVGISLKQDLSPVFWIRSSKNIFSFLLNGSKKEVAGFCCFACYFFFCLCLWVLSFHSKKFGWQRTLAPAIGGVDGVRRACACTTFLDSMLSILPQKWDFCIAYCQEYVRRNCLHLPNSSAILSMYRWRTRRKWGRGCSTRCKTPGMSWVCLLYPFYCTATKKTY